MTRAATSSVSMKAGKSSVKFVNAIPISELPPKGKAVGVIAGGLDVCVAVSSDGSIYALGNKAPPTGNPLKDGKVSKTTIKDAQFGTEFDLETGAVVGRWCPGGLGFVIGKLFEPTGVPTYKVKKAGQFLQIEVDVNFKVNYESKYWKGILDAQGKTDGGYY